MATKFTDGQLERLGDVVGRSVVRAMAEEKQRLFQARAEPRKIKSIDDLGSVWEKETTLEWLVPDLLPEGSVNLLSSRSGTGKTWLAYFLAGCVAHGSAVFGKEVKQRKVLYIDGENPLFVVKERLRNLGIADTPNLKIWGGWDVDRPPGPDDPLIREYAQKERPLLIWDSLVEFHTGDEQSSTATRAFMKHFRALANYGATVLILCHTGKADSSKQYRGSTDIEAAVDMAFLLESSDKDRKKLEYLTLDPFKCRICPLERRCLQYIEGKGFELSALKAEVLQMAKPNALAVVEQIIREHPGLRQTEIVKKAMEQGVSKNAAAETLKSARFRCEKGRGNAHHYYPAEEEPIQTQPAPEEQVA